MTDMARQSRSVMFLHVYCYGWLGWLLTGGELHLRGISQHRCNDKPLADLRPAEPTVPSHTVARMNPDGVSVIRQDIKCVSRSLSVSVTDSKDLFSEDAIAKDENDH